MNRKTSKNTPTIPRKLKNPTPAKTPVIPGTTVVEVTLDNTTLARIDKYKAAMGILKAQEVVRLATGVFLSKQGY